MDRFDTTPDPRFLRAMQAQKWNVSGALAELVDNSFGPGRGDARYVHITHHRKNRTIIVLDDGQGMDALGRLFQLGNTIGRSVGDIGEYGSGGTMALLWLARKIDIWTLRDGLVSHDTVNWTDTVKKGEFPTVSNDWEPVVARNVPADLLTVQHGTLIKIHLASKRRFYTSNTQRDLAAMYAPALRKGKQLVWTTVGRNGGTRTLGDAIPEPDRANSIVLNFALEVDGDRLPVHGLIGIIDNLPHSRSKVSIGYGHRRITTTRDCYSSPDGDERYAGTGVIGWLDLGEGWQPHLTVTKDAMDNQSAWRDLMAFVFRQIRPLLEQVENREMWVEFDQLSINLERALNGLATVHVEAGEQPTDEPGNDVGQRRGGEKARGEPSRKSEPDEGTDSTGTDQGLATVTIHRLSDEEMEGRLCDADMMGDYIAVYVNGDHPAIQEALRQEPVNRLMLNMSITREMADAITADREILEKLFRRTQLRAIDERDENKRVQFVHRILMDSVREPDEGAA